MATDNIDVLIIGAGPTGIMMAAEAARHGLNCKIIDKGFFHRDMSRAIGIQARTMEIFGQLGIAEDFLAVGVRVQAVNSISHFRHLARISFETLHSPYPFVLSLEQAKTEEILAKYASSMGVKIERGIECTQLVQTSQETEAILYHIQEKREEKVKVAWVIGCDGAHSLVRKQLGLNFAGKAFADIFSLADVQIHWDYPHNEVHIFLHPKGFLVAIPLPKKNCYRLVFQLLRCRDLLAANKELSYGQVSPQLIKEPTLQEIEALLQEYAGQNTFVTDPIWMANFHINSRMTKTYQKGRAFLAGDAAHIHSPIGAQGMNTGLQDAYNLAWKLALVHKNKASTELLKSYDLERHMVGKTILKTTEYASYMATLCNPVAIWFRNTMLASLAKLPFMQRALVKTISQTAICYPKSCIVVEKKSFKGPKAGVRAPNAPILLDEKPCDLYSLWKKTTVFHVLLFNGMKNTHPITIPSMASTLINITLITYKQSFSVPRVMNCIDPTGVAHQIYGAKTSCVYIIRPDGYIGYRSKGIDQSDIKSYFKAILSILL